MKKKNKTGLVILLVILIILFVAESGFVIYEKILKKDNSDNEISNNIETENQEEDAGENIENNEADLFADEDVKNSYNIVSNLGNETSGYEWNFNEKTTIGYNDLTESERNGMIINYLKSKELVVLNNETDTEITYSIQKTDFDNAIKNVFGEVEYVKPTNENSVNSNAVISDKETDYVLKTTKQSRESDGEEYIVLNTNKNEEKLEITVAYYYYKKEANEELPEEIIEYVYNNKNSEEKICVKEEVNTNIDKLKQYKFTFVKKETAYLFDNITLVN